MRAGTFSALLLAICISPCRTLRGDDDGPAILHQATERAAGDLDQMRQRGQIRVLVAPSRTDFFISRGELHGFSYDLMSAFAREQRGLTIVFIPLSYDELISALLDGRGDIAAAITVNRELQDRVVFSDPYLAGVDQVIVASKAAPEIHSLSELASRKVTVVKGRQPKSSIRFVEAPEALASEDLLEMANAGIIDFTVASKPIAEAWAEVLPNIRLHSELVVHRGDQIALAVRPESPMLLASLDDFVRRHRRHTLAGNELFRKYFENTRWLQNPLNDDPLRNLHGLETSFRKYGAEFHFDWLFLAAQGFQESGLRQEARSSVGAEGIMQLRPSTAREMGFDDIASADANIHAGAKYMAWLRDTFFDEPRLAPAARLHFTLAAYNAGPGNVKRWRETAKSRGRNPDKWLGNVELISLEEVGEQTYRYVRNIDKYYVAYTDWSRDLAERAVDVKSLEQRDGAR